MHTTGLVLGALLVLGSASFAAIGALPPGPRQPVGHLILQIEGDARALRVSRITPKPDPCGPIAGFVSEFSVAVFAADGTELGRYPLDLSAFDVDPARVGGAVRVEGCVVRDTRIATLANVPHWPDAARLEIARGGAVMGRLLAAEISAMTSAGGGR
jgi:hypothetical protein